MVEPAFGLLKTRINELLIDGQAQPARSSGAEAFEADPKSLTGSLLRIKEGSAVNGIGRYATVRQGQGLRMVADGGQQELKVSITGSGVAAGCHWMGREELGINVEAVIVGVMADGRTQTAKRGHRAGSVGAGVQLVAVVSNDGIEQISAITWLDGAPDEDIMAVEAAVVQYKMEWVPWRAQEQEDAQLPAAALPYEAEVPQRLYGAHDVEQGDRADAAARQCDILAKLGLLRSAPSAGGVQVGELCVSAAVLGGGNAGEGEYLRQWVTEEASQGKLLDAVIAVAEAISAAQPTLLDEAAAEAAEAARCLGQEAGEGVLPKGTAGIFALALRRRGCGWPPLTHSLAPRRRAVSSSARVESCRGCGSRWRWRTGSWLPPRARSPARQRLSCRGTSAPRVRGARLRGACRIWGGRRRLWCRRWGRR